MADSHSIQEPLGELLRSANSDVIDRLVAHAKLGRGALIVSAAPSIGCSSLLHTIFRPNAQNEGDVDVIHFRVKATDRSASRCAKRFTHSVLRMLDASRSTATSRTTSPFQQAEQHPVGDNDVIEELLSSAAIELSASKSPLVIVDDLHILLELENGPVLFNSFVELARTYGGPMILAGRRRFMFGVSGIENVEMEPTEGPLAVQFLKTAFDQWNTSLETAAYELIDEQCKGRPGFIVDIARWHALKGNGDKGFTAAQKALMNSLFHGQTGKWFDDLFASAFDRTRHAILPARLIELSNDRRQSVTADDLAVYLKLDSSAVSNALAILQAAEVLDVSFGRIRAGQPDILLDDYTKLYERISSRGELPEVVFTSMLAASIRRAPAMMAAKYRRASSLGLRELLTGFDGRQVPSAIFDRSRFDDLYKGQSDIKSRRNLSEDKEMIRLPTMAYVSDTEDIYPQISKLIERTRTAFGLGYSERQYNEEDEVYWIAAEIDSKLEATRETAEFWCDRLEAAALASGFSNFLIWLVASEGFDNEAADLLSSRKALGSSRKQADLLKHILKSGISSDASDAVEYQISIPMDDETELIAAHTLEEIAKRHGFDAHSINQIKTALIEACINAAEHSHSPDRRIHQTFRVGPDQITIEVTNRGVRLADASRPDADSPRRGWGLKLIEKLMDEVRVNETDDGTSITMIRRIGSTTKAASTKT